MRAALVAAAISIALLVWRAPAQSRATARAETTTRTETETTAQPRTPAPTTATRPLPPTVDTRPVQERPSGISGLVLGTDGKPYPYAGIYASDGGHLRTLRTEEDGTFQLDLPPGRYTLSADGYATDASEPFELTIERGERLAGLIFELKAAPPEAARDSDEREDDQRGDARREGGRRVSRLDELIY